MQTILFSKSGSTLVLKYSLKAFWRNTVLISVMFLIIIIGLYLLANGAKVPRDAGDFIFIGIMLGLYLLTMAYYSYTVYSRLQVELVKSYDGYAVRKNNKIRTGTIKLITKRRVMRQHDEGYSLMVTDLDDSQYTLFDTLAGPEADELTEMLSKEMNLPVEVVEGKWW